MGISPLWTEQISASLGTRVSRKKTTPPAVRGLWKRMMGLEPPTFCMASRRSSQLSYIRVGGQYSPAFQLPARVESLVHEPVGELVLLPPDRGVAHLPH